MEEVIKLIKDERVRQIEKEGYSKEHDKSTGGNIAFAAAIYATPTLLYEKENFANQIHFKVANMHEYSWQLALPHNGNVTLDNNGKR